MEDSMPNDLVANGDGLPFSADGRVPRNRQKRGRTRIFSSKGRPSYGRPHIINTIYRWCKWAVNVSITRTPQQLLLDQVRERQKGRSDNNQWSGGQQFEPALEHPWSRESNILPMRIISFAPPMKHQIKTGNHAKTITRECAEPSHLILRDREQGRLGIGFDDFAG